MKEQNKNHQVRKGLSLIWPQAQPSFTQKLMSSLKNGFSYLKSKTLSLMKEKQRLPPQPIQRKTKQAKKIQKRNYKPKQSFVSIQQPTSNRAISEMEEQDIESKFNSNVIDSHKIAYPTNGQSFYNVYQSRSREINKEAIGKKIKQVKEVPVYKKPFEMQKEVIRPRKKINIEEERKPCFNLTKLLDRMDQEHNNRLALIAKIKEQQRMEQERIERIREEEQRRIEEEQKRKQIIEQKERTDSNVNNNQEELSFSFSKNNVANQQNSPAKNQLQHSQLNINQMIEEQKVQQKKKQIKQKPQTTSQLKNQQFLKSPFGKLNEKLFQSNQSPLLPPLFAKNSNSESLFADKKAPNLDESINKALSDKKSVSCRESEQFTTPKKENPFMQDAAPLNFNQVLKQKSPSSNDKRPNTQNNSFAPLFAMNQSSNRAMFNPFSRNVFEATSDKNTPILPSFAPIDNPPNFPQNIAPTPLFNQGGLFNTNFFMGNNSQQQNFFSKPPQSSLFSMAAPTNRVKPVHSRRGKRQERINSP